jgi:hypothetical protein
MSKKTSHNRASLAELRKCVKVFQTHATILWDLKQAILGETSTISLIRKPHFLSHFDEVISSIGSLQLYDTGSWENAHIFWSTSIWDNTSKRYLDQPYI